MANPTRLSVYGHVSLCCMILLNLYVLHTMANCTTHNIAPWCDELPPPECYNSEELCCQRCMPFKVGPPGCEYGDKFVECQGIAPNRCYESPFKIDCCDTCAHFSNGQSECEFGDIFNDCERADCSDGYIRENCCETCKDWTSTTLAPTTTAPEPYCQNVATWCPTIPSRNCYVENHVCCLTCLSQLTGIEGCLYRDRVSWCHKNVNYKHDCDNRYIRQNCCFSCALVGLLTQERNSTQKTGTIIAIKDTTLQVTLKSSPSWVFTITELINVYCRNHREECCALSPFDIQYGDRPVRNGDFFVDPRNVRIAEGYPRPFTDKKIMLKILVTLSFNNVDAFCRGLIRNGFPRTTHEDDAVPGPGEREPLPPPPDYKPMNMDPELVKIIIIKYKDVINKELPGTVTDIVLPGEPITVEPQDHTVLILSVISSCIIMVTIIVLFAKWRANRFKGKEENGKNNRNKEGTGRPAWLTWRFKSISQWIQRPGDWLTDKNDEKWGMGRESRKSSFTISDPSGYNMPVTGLDPLSSVSWLNSTNSRKSGEIYRSLSSMPGSNLMTDAYETNINVKKIKDLFEPTVEISNLPGKPDSPDESPFFDSDEMPILMHRYPDFK